MINISIPNNNIKERKYIIEILFNEFLGLNYTLDIGSNDYEILLQNEKKIIIKDTFFNKYPNELEYLKLENIPLKIEDLDIFSASFFMLTRWEEYVNKNRDAHNRFPAAESLAYKQDFLDRPIVNEYIEELKITLLELDSNLKFKERNFEVFLTHDVDTIYRSIKSFIRELGGDLLKRKDIKLFFKNMINQIQVFLKIKKDPHDTFDYLMDISESIGVKSYFFLHSSSSAKEDCNNIKYLKKITKNILTRGHYVGYHPSYNAYNQLELFEKDKEKIENVVKYKLNVGRAHFLRFEIPTTWQIWEDSGMKWDSSLSFADKEGFRCGVCYEYSVFNILTRKKLNLKEKPLIVMEGSFVSYQSEIKPEEMEKRILNLMNEVKKYNGEFVFLWHNSSFNTGIWNKFQNIYKKVLVK